MGGPGVTDLIAPRVRGVWNTFRRADTGRKTIYLGSVALILLFWVGFFFGLRFVLDIFMSVEVFGPLLTRKLLEILLLALFTLLCFSNTVTAISTFYLSADLELLMALPVRRTVLFYARLTDTVLQSSWMMAMFGLPLFFAYGVVYEAGWDYLALLAVTLPAFVMIPAAVGVCLATVLVRVVPARRAREFMAIAGLFGLIAIVAFIRLLRPERFMDPEAFESLAAYVAELQAPSPVLFPPRWASDVLVAGLRDQPVAWVDLGLLVVGAAAACALCRWFYALVYERAWSQAQEASAPRMAGSPILDWFLRGFLWPLPRAWHPIVIKDVRAFFRDPSQWSQVFLLASLIAIYLFSVSVFPFDTFRGPLARTTRSALAFLNLGLTGFVMAGVAIRFQFVAVSAEGRAFWIPRSAPIRADVFLRAKAVLGLVPMLIVGLVLSLASTALLDTSWFFMVVALLTAFGLAMALSGLAVGMGAVWPDFKADSAARAAAGPSAMIFMVVGLFFVGIVLAIEAYPVFLVLRSSLIDQHLTTQDWVSMVALLAFAQVFCLATAHYSIRWGAKRLWFHTV